MLLETQSILGRTDVISAAREMKGECVLLMIVDLGIMTPEDGNLSDLDEDDEVQAILNVTPQEVEFKTLLWTQENQDWLAKQELKKLQGKDGPKKKPVKKVILMSHDVAQETTNSSISAVSSRSRAKSD